MTPVLQKITVEIKATVTPIGTKLGALGYLQVDYKNSNGILKEISKRVRLKPLVVTNNEGSDTWTLAVTKFAKNGEWDEKAQF